MGLKKKTGKKSKSSHKHHHEHDKIESDYQTSKMKESRIRSSDRFVSTSSARKVKGRGTFTSRKDRLKGTYSMKADKEARKRLTQKEEKEARKRKDEANLKAK